MRLGIFAMFLLMAGQSGAARLSPAAGQAFARYVADAEGRLARQHASPDTFISVLDVEPGQRTALERQLRSGAAQVEPVNGGIRQVNGALLHHWRAAAFVPGATPRAMLLLLRDYSHLSSYYAPELVSSSALIDNGETADLTMRLKKQQGMLTIVLDAEYGIETRLVGQDRGYSISRSRHIWQIDDPGTARERRRTEGDDGGFLWRLNSYWSFASTRDGLLIECEAISLTRDMPAGFGWFITPIVVDLSREALQFTLTATEKALKASSIKEAR